MAADEEAYTSENVRRILTLLTSWEKLAYSGAIQLLRRNSFAIQLLLALPIYFWKCSPYFNYTKNQVHFFLKSWQNYVRFSLSDFLFHDFQRFELPPSGTPVRRSTSWAIQRRWIWWALELSSYWDGCALNIQFKCTRYSRDVREYLQCFM